MLHGPSGAPPIERELYYYHPDQLGSTNDVTDARGRRVEHLEYFPFGESWVEEGAHPRRPSYRFTTKELDPSTGLYYFGARYYDPRTSVWQSADPILGAYLPGAGATEPNQLAGMGGVFNPMNLGLYSYAHLNPVRLIDPNGQLICKPLDGKYVYVSLLEEVPRACIPEADIERLKWEAKATGDLQDQAPSGPGRLSGTARCRGDAS